MALRLGVCRNKPTCSKARTQEKISMKWSKGICPECGKKLKKKFSISKKHILLILVIVSVLIGWLLFGDDEPNCLLSSPQEIRKKLPMARVPEMQGQKIPHSFHIWMKNIAHSTIKESAFFMMRREVTVGEFESYVKILSEVQLKKLGNEWQQDENGSSFPGANPVGSVPWWAAKGYAEWLSEETHCTLTLPTYNQWVAAAINYAKPKNAVIRVDKQTQTKLKPQQRDEEPSNVLDLLGNLREWSIDNSGQKQCASGEYYILGEDYKTWGDNIAGKPLCERSTLDTVGFRLVMQE